MAGVDFAVAEVIRVEPEVAIPAAAVAGVAVLEEADSDGRLVVADVAAASVAVVVGAVAGAASVVGAGAATSVVGAAGEAAAADAAMMSS